MQQPALVRSPVAFPFSDYKNGVAAAATSQIPEGVFLMTDDYSVPFAQNQPIRRRDAIKCGLATIGATALASEQSMAAETSPVKRDDRRTAPKRYNLKKSINMWAFPYPDRMTFRECLQLAKDAGFDAVELNYDLKDDLSVETDAKGFAAIRKMTDDIGIEISGLCSFLFWPYPMTSNDPAIRARSLELAEKMIEATHDLGVENLLVVPGAVYIPWRDDYEPVRNDICDRRAREAVGKLVKKAEKLGVYLNIENIFFSGYLMTPMEMNDFADSFGSDRVRIHFDTGNIAIFQHADHWIPQLGNRIQNLHFKEFNKKATDHSLECFRPLLDGTVNWPSVMDALAEIDYRGYATFEYFHPYLYYPEALIHQTSDSMDRILGRMA
jgi:L-ribulose-5-phosphate 3-epimerase